MIWVVRRHWKFALAGAIACAAGLFFYGQTKGPELADSTTVSSGVVSETIGISGFVDTSNAAQLSFPSVGVVTDILTHKGQQVAAGQLLATLGARELVANRAAAVANLHAAEADRQALQNGPTTESRAVTDATVVAAQSAYDETVSTETAKVTTALRALRSHDLTAVSTDPDEPATPPTVTGTYGCDTEGTYTLSVYRSDTVSGYSYRLTGLESGAESVFTDQPGPLGECGLSIQFSSGVAYADSAWTIDIPNTDSSTYLTYKNAYDLAVRQQTQNVAAAQAALDLAQNQGIAATAAPRIESLIAANAAVQAAEAQIAAVDARIAQYSITAPFAGTVTDVDIVTGETANLTPVITLVGSTTYAVTARVPEIDITKIAEGQEVQARFDAASNETYAGTITFVSPMPTTIEGVSYYDATVELTQPPQWIRAGLNADIDVIVTEQEYDARVPARFVVTEGDRSYIYQQTGRNVTPVDVSISFIGNNGYVALTGIDAGETVVLPVTP